jgi:hypothetical protein
MCWPARRFTLRSLSSLCLVGCGGSLHHERQVRPLTPPGSVDHAGSVESYGFAIGTNCVSGTFGIWTVSVNTGE